MFGYTTLCTSPSFVLRIEFIVVVVVVVAAAVTVVVVVLVVVS